jgi:hypothetical protein
LAPGLHMLRCMHFHPFTFDSRKCCASEDHQPATPPNAQKRTSFWQLPRLYVAVKCASCFCSMCVCSAVTSRRITLLRAKTSKMARIRQSGIGDGVEFASARLPGWCEPFHGPSLGEKRKKCCVPFARYRRVDSLRSKPISSCSKLAVLLRKRWATEEERHR